MRPAILAVLATAAISALTLPLPVRACSYAYPRSSPSIYEAVDAASRIVLARAVGSSKDGSDTLVHFRVEEVLKGEPGEAVVLYGDFMPEGERGYSCLCGPPCDYVGGHLYVLFLEREDQGEDQGWSLSNLDAPVNQEVEPEDDWVQAVRLYSGISALNEEVREREALRDLRARVEAGEESYPKGLKEQLDRHFRLPSPRKPFSELMDFYDAAESDEQRLAVLWALVHGSHPETSAFFRRLLLSGEPDWLLEPAMEWFSSEGGADLPRIEELARAYLGYPPGQRRPLLVLIWEIAEPKDIPLLWSLLPGSSLGEIKEMLDWIAFSPWGAARIPLLARLYRKSEERLRRELIRTWMRSDSTPEAFLGRLLLEAEGLDPREQSLERLAGSLGKSSAPADRRRILLRAFLRARAEDSPVLWQLLRKAEGWEADLLVEWFDTHPLQSFESMLSLYRSARTEVEKDRALWVSAVGRLNGELNYDYLGRLLATAGDLGEGPRRLHRLARAFHSCPNAESRSRMVTQITNGVAQAEDFPLVREILRSSTVNEARGLARWFSRHPSPEVIPDFRERLRVVHEDLWIPDALAAAGDPEILDWALKVLRRPDSDNAYLATSILSHSPLPAAAEQIWQTLAEGGESLYSLIQVYADSDNRSPYRWWFFEQILRSDTLSPEYRLTAIKHLRNLAKAGEETAKRLLAELAPEPS